MDDLEAQIGRLAEHRADQIEPTTSLGTQRRRNRSGRWLAAAAAIVLVGVGGWLVTRGDDEGTTSTIDPVGFESTTTAATVDDDAEPSTPTTSSPSEGEAPDPETADQPDVVPDLYGEFPPAPLAPRHSAAIVPLGLRVVVWGGVVESSIGRLDLEATSHVDGAVLDVWSQSWTTMAPSPLVDSFQPVAAMSLGDQAVIARGQTAAIYDLATDTWTSLPDLPFQVDELFLLDGSTIAAVGVADTHAFLTVDEDDAWVPGQQVMFPGNVAWTTDGSRLIAATKTEGWLLELFTPGITGVTAISSLPTTGIDRGAFVDVAVVGERIMLVPERGPIWSYDLAEGSFSTDDLELGSSYEVEPVAESTSDGRLAVRALPRVMIGDPTGTDLDEPFLSVSFPGGLDQYGSVLAGDTWWSFGLFVSDAGTELMTIRVPGSAGPEVTALVPADSALVGSVRLPLIDFSYDGFEVLEGRERITISRTGSNLGCTLDFWWGPAPADVGGSARAFSDGTAIAACSVAGAEQSLLDRLVSLVEPPPATCAERSGVDLTEGSSLGSIDAYPGMELRASEANDRTFVYSVVSDVATIPVELPPGPSARGVEVIGVHDLNADGQPEIVLGGFGNTARTAVALTIDGCQLTLVAGELGDGFLLLVGASSNSCAPTGCPVRVRCVGTELELAVLGPEGELMDRIDAPSDEVPVRVTVTRYELVGDVMRERSVMIDSYERLADAEAAGAPTLGESDRIDCPS